MVQINFARKEINCKLVFYGPGLSGKTTNLEKVHERTPDANKGELTSISTDGDRTLFFDFMPLDLGEIAGMKTKFHLYTVPGQVYYNSTRKLVLLGADGVLFVADSSRAKLDENKESLQNLRENLIEMGKDFTKFPVVLQWNKRDVEDAMPIEELEKELNPLGFPSFAAIAYKGEGVFQTLKALSALVLKNINSHESAPRASAPAQEPSRAGSSGPATASLAIERNEVKVAHPVGAGGAPPVSRSPMEEVMPVAARASGPPTSSGPKTGFQQPATQSFGGAAAPPQHAPETTATAVRGDKASHKRDEVMSDQMRRRAEAAQRESGETLHREVKVVGAPGGRSKASSGSNTGVIIGVVVVVAALAAAWYFFA